MKKYDSRHVFRLGGFTLTIYRLGWMLRIYIGRNITLTEFTTYVTPANPNACLKEKP